MNKNDLRTTENLRRAIRRDVVALEEILVALTPLSFDERRRLLRWACERYGIAADRLTSP